MITLLLPAYKFIIRRNIRSMGTGKSTLLNYLIGAQVTIATLSPTAVTKDVTEHVVRVGECLLLIINVCILTSYHGLYSFLFRS